MNMLDFFSSEVLKQNSTKHIFSRDMLYFPCWKTLENEFVHKDELMRLEYKDEIQICEWCLILVCIQLMFYERRDCWLFATFSLLGISFILIGLKMLLNSPWKFLEWSLPQSSCTIYTVLPCQEQRRSAKRNWNRVSLCHKVSQWHWITVIQFFKNLGYW